MRTLVDDRFREEARRFKLRFTCDSCAYFAPEREACSEGYPTAEHRSDDLQRAEIVFCKLFEGA